MHLANFVFCVLGYRPVELKVVYPRGVRRGSVDSELVDDRYGRPTLKVVDSKRGVGVGVRKDVHGCLFVDSFSTVVGPPSLHFDQPCVCGSYTHRTTRSLKCLLCNQFLD